MPTAFAAFGDGGLTSVLRPHNFMSMQTQRAAEMTVATCSSLGFKKLLSPSRDALHHTHFISKGLKREVADAACLCAKLVVPLQEASLFFVLMFFPQPDQWSMACA